MHSRHFATKLHSAELSASHVSASAVCLRRGQVSLANRKARHDDRMQANSWQLHSALTLLRLSLSEPLGPSASLQPPSPCKLLFVPESDPARTHLRNIVSFGSARSLNSVRYPLLRCVHSSSIPSSLQLPIRPVNRCRPPKLPPSCFLDHWSLPSFCCPLAALRFEVPSLLYFLWPSLAFPIVFALLLLFRPRCKHVVSNRRFVAILQAILPTASSTVLQYRLMN